MNGVDSLTDAMGSLKLVPTKIQFGRGAKRGGFSSQNRHNLSHRMDVDEDDLRPPPRRELPVYREASPPKTRNSQAIAAVAANDDETDDEL